jgi:hypothetical protein
MQLEKTTMYLMEVITNKEGYHPLYLEPLVLTMHNVATPPTHGGLRVDGSILLAEPKTNLYGRSESSCFTLVETLGEAYSAAASVQMPARKQAVVFENLKESGFTLRLETTAPWIRWAALSVRSAEPEWVGGS